jgi:hypothetical protein
MMPTVSKSRGISLDYRISQYQGRDIAAIQHKVSRQNIANVTGKRNAQASEMRTFAKTTPLSTTPYNVATT